MSYLQIYFRTFPILSVSDCYAKSARALVDNSCVLCTPSYQQDTQAPQQQILKKFQISEFDKNLITVEFWECFYKKRQRNVSVVFAKNTENSAKMMPELMIDALFKILLIVDKKIQKKIKNFLSQKERWFFSMLKGF